MFEKSCGAVLYTEKEKRLYVLVKSTLNNHWGLPKGHVECDEAEHETALREITEETGVNAEIVKGFREQIEYIMPNGNNKQVVFFVAKYENQELRTNQIEINSIKTVTLDEALNMISHDDVKNVLLIADNFISSHTV